MDREVDEENEVDKEAKEEKDIGMAELRKHSSREEGETNYDCCREEDPLPEHTLVILMTLMSSDIKLLPAVLVKEVEGADGTEDFCQTEKKEDEP